MSQTDVILKIARSEIGVKESPKGSNKQKYGKTYGLDGVPWCVIFIWWVFLMANLPKLFFNGNKTASCTTLLEWAKKKGIVGDTPRVGAIMILKTSGGRHAGIVEEVLSATKFTSIEGNTSLSSDDNGGCVMRRTRTTKNVVAFIYPQYEEQTRYLGTFPSVTLKKSMKGAQVVYLQKYLNWYFQYNRLATDGSFGPATLSAVKDYQAAEKLVVDGSFGPKSLAKAKTVLR